MEGSPRTCSIQYEGFPSNVSRLQQEEGEFCATVQSVLAARLHMSMGQQSSPVNNQVTADFQISLVTCSLLLLVSASVESHDRFIATYGAVQSLQNLFGALHRAVTDRHLMP